MDANYIARFLKELGSAIEETQPDKEDLDEGVERFIIIQMLKGNISLSESVKLLQLKDAVIECFE